MTLFILLMLTALKAFFNLIILINQQGGYMMVKNSNLARRLNSYNKEGSERVNSHSTIINSNRVNKHLNKP
jgi:hypothetical protein